MNGKSTQAGHCSQGRSISQSINCIFIRHDQSRKQRIGGFVAMNMNCFRCHRLQTSCYINGSERTHRHVLPLAINVEYNVHSHAIPKYVPPKTKSVPSRGDPGTCLIHGPFGPTTAISISSTHCASVHQAAKLVAAL